MKSLLVIATLLLTINISFGQDITLSDIPLNWSSFRIIEKRNNEYAAQVGTRINYQLKMSPATEGKICSVTTNSYVDNANSVVDRHFFDEANAMDKERCLRHEKGHFVICLIQQKKFQKLLEQHVFHNPIQTGVDSLFQIIQSEWRKMNLQYDQATDHGKNGSQDQWETSLLLQMNDLYKGVADYTSTYTTLHVSDDFAKISDPARYSYPGASVAFDYSFDANRPKHGMNNLAFPVSIDTPYHRSLTDSTVYIDSLDFSRDFELELTFQFEEKIPKKAPGLVLGWTMSKVSFVDAENTSLSFAPSYRKYFGLLEKGKKKKEAHSSFSDLQMDSWHSYTLRKIGSNYLTFVDGRFEKEMSCDRPEGKRLYWFVVKGLCTLHRVRFSYL